jgi:hypothetical protein
VSAFHDLTGLRFGRLTVLEPVENFECGRNRKWKCVCDCGAVVDVRASHMKSGASKSCGCLSVEMTKARSTTHGQSHGTAEYKTWANIRSRCEDQKHISFKYYGAKGVKVCERWQAFQNFFADMGLRPSKHHSIDRYPDKNGNYEPGNCRWATEVEQQNNRSNNMLITSGGVTMTEPNWARKLGFGRQIIRQRILRGWSVEKSLSKTT